MDSKIDNYWNDSDNDNEKDESPGQGIEVCTAFFEYIEYNKISHSNYYSGDKHRSPKKRYIHRRIEKINILCKWFRKSQITIGKISNVFDAIFDGS